MVYEEDYNSIIAINQAADRLIQGVTRAIQTGKWSAKTLDPETARKYTKSMSEFLGKPISKAAENYMIGVQKADIDGAWISHPTDVKKWKMAMMNVK